MKKTFVILAAMSLVFVLGLMVGGSRLQPVGAVTAVAAPVAAPLAVPVPPRCPNVHEAIRALEIAHHDLEEASHNYCGHKGEAMRAVHVAIEQLRMAENCDRCR